MVSWKAFHEKHDAAEREAFAQQARDDAAAMSVYAYFTKTLGIEPFDETLKTLPITSGCGQVCCQSIDAAAGLLIQVKRAFGDTRPNTVCRVIETCAETIEAFFHG